MPLQIPLLAGRAFGGFNIFTSSVSADTSVRISCPAAGSRNILSPRKSYSRVAHPRSAERAQPAQSSAWVLRSIRPMKNSSTSDTDQPGLQRDPDEWKTGDEPMTAAQRSYLETLCRETGEEFDDSLSKADASKRIDELRERSPRLAGE